MRNGVECCARSDEWFSEPCLLALRFDTVGSDAHMFAQNAMACTSVAFHSHCWNCFLDNEPFVKDTILILLTSSAI